MNLPGEGEEIPSLYMNLPGEGEASSGGGGEEMEREKKATLDRKRETTPESPAIFVNDVELNYGAKEVEGETTKRSKRDSKKDRKEQKKLEKEHEKQEEKERKQREKLKKKEKKKSRSPSPSPEVVKKSPSPPKEESMANGMSEDSSSPKVKVVEPLSQVSDGGQPVSIVLDTTQAGEGELLATCKGTKVKFVHVEVKKQENGCYCVQFTPEAADMYMLSVQWGEKDISGSPFIVNLNHLPIAAKGEGEQEGQEKGEESKSTEEEEVTQNGAEGMERKQKSGQDRTLKDTGSSVGISAGSDDPFDRAYQASRLLGESSDKECTSYVVLPVHTGMCTLKGNCLFLPVWCVSQLQILM